MSDSRKTPPFGSKKPLRASSEGVSRTHDRSLPQGSRLKEFVDEEITGQYEGEELELRRALRPPEDRIDRLEKKHDELKQEVREKHDELKKDVSEVRTDIRGLSTQVGDVRADVAGATGKLDGQDKVLVEMLSLVKKTADRDHVTFTAKVEVDKERELAEVAVDKERALAEVAVDKTGALDKFASRRARRKMVLRALGLLASGGGIIELLHRLGVL
jgi:chromosome segregation ATPase